jgi:YHS domain-containing protein
MKKFNYAIVAICVALFLTYSAIQAEDKKADTVKCPVAGKVVKLADAKSSEYKGGKVYFCCAGCQGKFEKDTAKYAAKANHQLVATKQAKLVKCPIAGKALNPATKIDVAGVAVCFCCNGCKGKAVKAKGDAQIELIFNDEAFAKGFEVAKK